MTLRGGKHSEAAYIPLLAPGERVAEPITVELDADSAGSPWASPRQLAAQLPAPESLPEGSWVAVARECRSVGRRKRLWHRRPQTLHFAARCTALAALGFVDVCGGSDGAAYARVPRGGPPRR